MGTTVVPYKDRSSGKKEQVAEMFDDISGRYDFLNRFLSLGIDVRWRKKAIRKLAELVPAPERILDVATGTGDVAIAALKLNPKEVVGVDISEGMLAHGRIKLKKKKLDDRIHLQSGDSENLQFPDGSFDAITVAYGVRNFENLEKGLGEMLRVLRPGGALIVLEFAQPRKSFFRPLFMFYFKRVLPTLGKWISGNKEAYTYLPESVQAFPDGEKFLDILTKLGYRQAGWKSLTFGVSGLYWAQK